MATKKTTKNQYGLWLIMNKAMTRKVIAVIESNELGVKAWCRENGHREDRVAFSLLPQVEYFDPVESEMPDLLAAFNATAKATAKAKATRPIMRGQAQKMVAGIKICPASGRAIATSKVKAGGRGYCPVCGKEMTMNGSRYAGFKVRKHNA